MIPEIQQLGSFREPSGELNSTFHRFRTPYSQQRLFGSSDEAILALCWPNFRKE
jgi:hypothetical protein